MWEEIVGTQGEQKLGAVFLLGDLLAARESGLVVPSVGEEQRWIEDNFDRFTELAKEDSVFRDFVEELQNGD